MIENQDIVHELTDRIQELQNEINCINDSRDFKMLNQYAVDDPTWPANQSSCHLIQTLVECLAVLWEYRAAEKGRQAFGTHMVYRETFCKSNGVFFSTLSAGIESMEL